MSAPDVRRCPCCGEEGFAVTGKERPMDDEWLERDYEDRQNGSLEIGDEPERDGRYCYTFDCQVVINADDEEAARDRLAEIELALPEHYGGYLAILDS